MPRELVRRLTCVGRIKVFAVYFTLFSQRIHDNFSSSGTYINIFYDIITNSFKNVSSIYEDSYYCIRSFEVREK
ncbi:hypothetical protein CWE34_06155 [Bacillus sp. SN10]|nr:hypothetical protein CWE34_06155 [Bacillus sp. SN10]